MHLTLQEPEGWQVLQGAYVWYCVAEDCLYGERPIAAPECDWRYWGIPDAELEALRLEDPEPYAAFVSMRERYRRRKKEGKKHD
jgi:hypothetical protein